MALRSGLAVFRCRLKSSDFPDGTELTRQLRSSSYNRMTPVVLLSSDTRPRALAEGFEAGATFFLYKPIDKDRLLRLVRATHAAMDHKLMRRTRRVPLTSKVQLYFGDQEIVGETVNASLEGVLVKASKTLPMGSSVNMKLYLDKTMTPVKASGSVVRLSDTGEIGVHFGRLNLQESQRLEEFLLPYIPAM
jgi:hypothetical protein